MGPAVTASSYAFVGRLSRYPLRARPFACCAVAPQVLAMTEIRLPEDAGDILFVAEVTAAPRARLLRLIGAVSDELEHCSPARRTELLDVLQFVQDALHRSCSSGAAAGGSRPRLIPV